jgi:hypothetical protein
MADQNRLFEAGPDPFGRMWRVQFRWLQTGISIRHADTVDVKFLITPIAGETSSASESEEKVIAFQHSDLLRFCEENKRKLSDPLCLRLAAAHLRNMIETSEDMDKTLVTATYDELLAADRAAHGETVPQRG